MLLEYLQGRKYWPEKPKFDKFFGHLIMNFQFETGNNSIMNSEVNEVWINGGTTISTLGNEFFVFEGPTRAQVRGREEYFLEGTGFGIVKVCGFEGWRVMLRINGARYSPNVTSVLSAIQIKELITSFTILLESTEESNVFSWTRVPTFRIFR